MQFIYDDIIWGIRSITHLIEDAYKFPHIPIRVIGLQVDLPDVSVVELIGGKPVGDDWWTSPRLNEPFCQRLGVPPLYGEG